MRTLVVGVCLTAAGIISRPWNPIESKENLKMEQQRSVAGFVKADALPPSPGYSQAVEVRPGRIIYVAGQVSMDRSGNLVGEGDMRAQAQQTFENLKAALEASGAKFENVVKLNYYVLDAAQLPAVREVRDKFVNTANPPASTAVEVKRLFREGFLIEVEAVAALPQ
jgi:reactive intermediate/imine deaminase